MGRLAKPSGDLRETRVSAAIVLRDARRCNLGASAPAPGTNCDVYQGALPHLWWPWNVDELKKQLSTDLQTTNVAAQTCKGLDVAVLTQWNIFYEGAIAWATSSTSWFGLGGQADQGQRYQCQLYGWQQTIASAQCNLPTPQNPDPSGHRGLPAGTSDSNPTADAVKWLGIAVAAAAGAYVVGEIVTVGLTVSRMVPSRKP